MSDIGILQADPDTPAVPARRSAIAPFMAMDVLAAAKAREREGHSVLHLELGEPGASPPSTAIAAARAALDAGRIGYTEALGLPALRSRIAEHYRELYRISIPPERVVVTTGSSGGFTLAFLSMFDAGDRVAIAAPGYPAYRNILKALGLEVVEIETGPADRWSLTAEAVLSAHREQPLKGVLTMSPANPTGVMMGAEALGALTSICTELGIWLISDEIYHGLTYGTPAETALRFSGDAVIVNSFSKYFCMTGWRVGWLIVPERLVRPLERLAQSLTISVPYLSQVAAHAAFDAPDELEAVRAGYATNRQILMEGFGRVGLGRFLPIDGAFYAYVDVGHLTNDSGDFCQRMLREAGVAATPGLDFDRSRGARFVRFSFAGTTQDVTGAVERLGLWLGTEKGP